MPLGKCFLLGYAPRSRINKQNMQASMCWIPQWETSNPTRQRARQWMGGVSAPGMTDRLRDLNDRRRDRFVAVRPER